MSKHVVLDIDLVAIRPENSPVDKQFTDAVMAQIHPKREIIPTAPRTTGVTHKKETWYMKFTKLPVAAMIAIILAAIIGVSGVAYAAYQLWPKPETKTSGYHLDVNDRTELTATLQNCDGEGTSTTTYELKKNATITKAQIPEVLQAQCELHAIEAYAQQTAPNGYSGGSNNKMVIVNPVVHTVKAIKGRKIVLAPNTEGGDKYNITITVSPDTKLIAGGNDAALGNIKPGDIVTYASDNLYSDEGGWPIKTHIQLIVKLGLSFAAYSPKAYTSLTEIMPCIGNPQDDCKTGAAAGIDIYDTGGYGNTSVYRQFDGRIVALSPQAITLKGSSGQTLTINTTSDIIGAFNATKLGTYHLSAITIGDSLTVEYNATGALNATRVIPESQLIRMSLDLEESNTKATTPTKY